MNDIRGAARPYLPAIFLLLGAALWGLRYWGALAAFAAVFFICLAFFEDDFSVSGLGVWGLLVCWLAAGLAFSPEPLNSFRSFFRYFLFFIFFIFSRGSGRAARGPWIFSVFCLGVLASAVSLIEVFLGSGPGGLAGVNPNYGAAFMAAALAGAAAALFDPACRKEKLLAGAGLVFLSAGLLASNSRGGLLALLAALLYLMWMKKALRPALYLAAASLIVPTILSGSLLSWLLKLDNPHSLERLRIWHTALEGIAAAPLFGSGLGLFGRVFEFFKFPFYDGVSYFGHYTPHAHSEFLNLAAEAGIPAACLLVWAWGRAVFTADGGDKREITLKVFSVALFVQASVDIIFYSGALQLFFFGTLGLLAAGREPALTPAGSRTRILVLSFLLVCWCAVFIPHFKFERDKVCALDPGREPSVRQACLAKAAVFAPGDPALLSAAAPLALAISGNRAYAAALAGEAKLSRPKDPFPMFDRAEAFLMAGAASAAKAELYGALALEPAFVRARLRLVEILVSEKNYRAAEAELARAEETIGKKVPERISVYDRELLYVPEGAYERLRNRIWRKR